MKRISAWLLGTMILVILLFGYRTSTAGPEKAAADGTEPAGGTTGSGATVTTKNGVKTVTGSVAQTEWGPVQVRLTIRSGKIVKAAAIRYPDGNPRDGEINAQALPILVNETLSAQSGKIDMVSGATVTSDGYIESLQAAIDKAGL